MGRSVTKNIPSSSVEPKPMLGRTLILNEELSLSYKFLLKEKVAYFNAPSSCSILMVEPALSIKFCAFDDLHNKIVKKRKVHLVRKRTCLIALAVFLGFKKLTAKIRNYGF